jgi:pyrroline-5-carboxylate reductase
MAKNILEICLLVIVKWFYLMGQFCWVFLCQDLGAESLFENVPVVEKSDVIIVSVKPSVVPIALGDIKNAPDIKADKLFLSIAMGVTIKQLEQVRTSPASAQTHKFVSVLAERVSSGAGDA